LESYVTGTSIKWYDAPVGGNLLSDNDVLSTASYYASQTIGGCESQNRLEVDVVVHESPIITQQADQYTTYYVDDTPLPLEVKTQPIPVGGVVKYQWYMVYNGKTTLVGDTTVLTPSTSQPGNFQYKLFIQISYPDKTVCVDSSNVSTIDVKSKKIIIDAQAYNTCPQTNAGMIKFKISGGDPYSNGIPYIVNCKDNKGSIVYSKSSSISRSPKYLSSLINPEYIDSILNLAADEYELVVRDSFSTDSVSIRIGEFTPPKVNHDVTQINLDKNILGKISINVSGGYPPYHYIWTKNGVAIPDTISTLTDLSSGKYVVSVIDSTGCASVKDSVKIEPGVPNTFTPDNDGHNDRFLVGFNIEIFSRNGILLYEGTDGWDGKYKGQDMAEDTYLYVIKQIIDAELEYKQGTVTLVRATGQ
jgi:gliding motility-associated-like protein